MTWEKEANSGQPSMISSSKNSMGCNGQLQLGLGVTNGCPTEKAQNMDLALVNQQAKNSLIEEPTSGTGGCSQSNDDVWASVKSFSETALAG